MNLQKICCFAFYWVKYANHGISQNIFYCDPGCHWVGLLFAIKTDQTHLSTGCVELEVLALGSDVISEGGTPYEHL